MRKKECAGSVIVELAAIVALDALNSDTELCSNIGKEVRQCGKGVGL